MFSTSSSSFQQLASPRPLSPRPSLLYSSKVSFRCLRLQSNTPPRRRLETTIFGRDFPSFLSTSTVSFLPLGVFSRGGRSRRRRLARNVRRFRALHLGRVSFTYWRDHPGRLRGIVRPFRRDDGRPRRVGHAVQDVLFLSFFPLFPLFPLFATAGAQHDCLRRCSSRSLPSRGVDLLVHVESRDVLVLLVLLVLQEAQKAKARRWYLLPFSLSLFRNRSAFCCVKER